MRVCKSGLLLDLVLCEMKHGGLSWSGAVRTCLDSGGNGSATEGPQNSRWGLFLFFNFSLLSWNSLFSHKEQQWDRKGVLDLPRVDPSCRDPHWPLIASGCATLDTKVGHFYKSAQTADFTSQPQKITFPLQAGANFELQRTDKLT